MSQFDLVLLGGLAAVALYWAFLGLRKAWQMVNSIERALAAIPKVQKSLDDLVLLLRAVVTGGNPNIGLEGLESQQPQEGFEQANRAPFPSPVFDRFRVKEDEPDAVPEDTEVIWTTDEEMVDHERVENLRQAGFQVEEPETQHKAIEVDSE